jgi:hypothetical protein
MESINIFNGSMAHTMENVNGRMGEGEKRRTECAGDKTNNTNYQRET